MKKTLPAIAIAIALVGCNKDEEYRYEFHQRDSTRIVFDRKTGTIYFPSSGASVTKDGLLERTDGSFKQFGVKEDTNGASHQSL